MHKTHAVGKRIRDSCPSTTHTPTSGSGTWALAAAREGRAEGSLSIQASTGPNGDSGSKISSLLDNEDDLIDLSLLVSEGEDASGSLASQLGGVDEDDDGDGTVESMLATNTMVGGAEASVLPATVLSEEEENPYTRDDALSLVPPDAMIGEPALEALLAEGGKDLSLDRICRIFPFPLDGFQVGTAKV